MSETEYKTRIKVISSRDTTLAELEERANNFIDRVETPSIGTKVLSTQFTDKCGDWAFIITYTVLL